MFLLLNQNKNPSNHQKKKQKQMQKFGWQNKKPNLTFNSNTSFKFGYFDLIKEKTICGYKEPKHNTYSLLTPPFLTPSCHI
jgi:hypothetical protein